MALIGSLSDRELARDIEYLTVENKILPSRIPGQVHTKPEELKRFLKFGNASGTHPLMLRK